MCWGLVLGGCWVEKYNVAPFFYISGFCVRISLFCGFASILFSCLIGVR